MAGAGKHILCTGGAGYIGSHTVVKLLESGYKVTIMDNLMNSNPKVIGAIKELTGTEVPLHKIDMCDAQAVDKLFEEQKFDGVIHFAGLKAVGESVAKPLYYYSNNLVGTLNILSAMLKHSCSAIVFSSSATEPLDEGKPMGCSNPYGWTKYMIEQIILDTAKANSHLKVSVLRYFNPVGAHPSGIIGESPNAAPNNLMPFVQQVAVGRRPELAVFGSDYNTPDGTGVRDYIHVDDLAEGHIAAMTKLMTLTEGASLIHNLGSGTGDLATVVANPAKAKADFGWETKRTLEDMCNSAWKWQSEHPYGFDEPPAAA